MGSHKKLHVVLIPLPAQGHVIPIIYLARKLALLGVTVTIINVDSIHETLQQSWKSEDNPVSNGHDIRLESISMDMRVPNGFDEKNFDAQAAFCEAIFRMEDPLAELLSRIDRDGPRVACVVSDFYHLSAPHAAKKAGLAGASFWPGNAAWAAIEFHVPKLLEMGDIPVKAGDEKLISYIPGMELRSQDIPVFMHDGEFQKNGEEQSLYRSKRIALDSWFLINSVHDIEPRIFEAMREGFGENFVPVGPLFPLKGEGIDSTGLQEVNLRTPDESCLPWLDKRDRGSVLYVSFGSISFMTAKQFEEIALGLEASKVSFLWVIRSNSVLGMDEEFYKGFVSRTGGRGLFVRWAPQLEILQHESTGAFLTHCGWNSMLESLACGVPMLGWPSMFEQNTNAKLVLEGEGVGVAFSRSGGKDGFAPREEVEEKVRAIMEGEQGRRLKARAMEIRELAVKAASPGGSSHANLKKFVESLAS
ncbi:UDP-glycosyltransferase 85A3 [Selaginella moellendorffii]|uniref:UDP-glycosyltransferase 85A3 n=1 Tax=Selaginella moellendorffii TaxID=88036 RepID=UPI000D1C4F59|nr:UDP-glycosyltransferase 85A3 [Selaginella moellendorffii]|eukprot:XP_024517123.1 UDP-glycosyltransferase 85A3 [Selaginella moellendorffii]